MKPKPLIYEKRIVAFLDLLGFSTMFEYRYSKVDTPLRSKIMQATEIIRESADVEETGRTTVRHHLCISFHPQSLTINYKKRKSKSTKNTLSKQREQNREEYKS